MRERDADLQGDKDKEKDKREFLGAEGRAK